MEVIDCGSAVLIGDTVNGIVTGINISFGVVQYQVVWWDKNIRNQEWLEVCEVSQTSKTEHMTIGFNRNGEPCTPASN